MSQPYFWYDIGVIPGVNTAPFVDDPAAAPNSTFRAGSNDVGQIVGNYLDSAGVSHGFVYSAGAFVTLDVLRFPTYLTDINDAGFITGYYVDRGQTHGVLYDPTLMAPNGHVGNFVAVEHMLTGIDNARQIIGIDNQSHGFFGATSLVPTPPPFDAAVTAETVYLNEYGSIPTNLDAMIAFVVPQFSYGQQIGVMDPVIYAYEALGAALASTAPAFQQQWGTRADFVPAAYTAVFGHPGTAAQIQQFTDQLNFFDNLYTGNIPNPDLVARGAIYGQMLGIHAEIQGPPVSVLV